MYQIYNEDCLKGMKKIPDGSVDMILTDLPYGITNAPFDRRIPFAPMWEQFNRVTKKNAAVALFANGKFLIELAASNLHDYRYKWVWHKNLGVGFLNAKKMPLKIHEDILIFYRQLPTYNPQFTQGKPYVCKGYTGSANYQAFKNGKGWLRKENFSGKRYPTDVQEFKLPFAGGMGDKSHPTQKPTDLLEYLIKTYTNEGELVLDATMGSGSTGVACVNTNRQLIGFEKEQHFFEIAQKRIAEAVALKVQSLF
ncbi:MAG: site-specific DNA-methyltransferase [Selenomonadaceae bacterium]|nr:site-specific DNA-methyltransferase [Selenomonadaceae bacterium]